MAYWKKLNNDNAVPVLKDELVLDTTPTVNSTNPVTSDGVARAISGSGDVPAPGAGDDGKVLTVVSGVAAWAPSQGGGASYTAGDGIAIDNGEISAKVDGDTITVNDNGELVANGGGGASYTAGPAIQIESDTIDVRLNTNSGLLKADKAEMTPMGGPSEKEPLFWAFPFGSSSMLNSVELPEISELQNVPADYDLDGAVNLILVYGDGERLHPEDDGYAVSVYTGYISFNGEWGMWELRGGQIIPVNADSEHWTFHDNFTFAGWDEWGNPPAALLTLKGTVGGDAPNGEIIIAGTAETGVPCYPMAPGLKVEYPLPAPGEYDDGKVLTVQGGVAAWAEPQGSTETYVEANKFWEWGYDTYTSNDVTIAPDFSQDEDWGSSMQFQGYSHCREVQMYGKFEGGGTTEATNNASTTVTLVFENRYDNTDNYTIALTAKQYAKNYVVDPQGSQLQRYGILFTTEEFQVPFDCEARKMDGTDYFLKSIHVAFAGLTSGGTALTPDAKSIAFRTITFPYWG